ncbi:MAG: hypothetical protein KCHDKBKB_03080 [Elusimicrobia bacterium]|nr:hypothetical protein [Elusimicrobiota bacterium]
MITYRSLVSRGLKALSVLLVFTGLAQAHIIPGESHGLTHGFAHPLMGLDHVLAMIAVGLWAAQLGKKAYWRVPTTFVGIMAAGAILGIAGFRVAFVEEGILLSVLILGVLIATAAPLSVGLSQLIVGLFALFHGHSHGTEMPMAASGLAYGVGFIASTALLHGLGIGLAILSQKVNGSRVIRYAGAAIACAGLILFFR